MSSKEIWKCDDFNCHYDIKTGTVSEVNDEEPILLHWNSSLLCYGCNLLDVLISSNKLTNYGYVSMANISDIVDQHRGALCLELMLNKKA
ncbi:hypothetical protein X798_06591 [Onchocerca flexuosa]|uniref:Uncharacterized protein n=1 Tax=Onchocerca flexuosa TaxID=387005 RepID=A0A238BLZ0_9BILA|nr:hypothetical protein X798_06591 [Onchocerca flexuosa]